MTHLGTTPPVRHCFIQEWDRLRRRPASLRRANAWGVVDDPLDDLDQLLDLTLPEAAGAETALRSLVELARTDELAARVVLQRLLPELTRIHRRRSWQGWRDIGYGDLLATGWTVIRTYNLDRRPVRLANALVSDIEYREYRAPLRRKGHSYPTEPDRLDAVLEAAGNDRPTDPVLELARLLADAVEAGVPDDDLDLVRRLASGRLAVDIARDLDVTPRTIRNRRDRIAVRLREVALAA